MTLLCRQNNQVTGSRQKTIHLNFAWHMFQDRNMISYTIVTHTDFPDQFANNFLKGLSNMLYERSPEFKKNPHGIETLDTMARHVIHELQASFDGSSDFTSANLDIEEGKGEVKTDKIQRTLNQVSDKMRGNLNRMFENQDELHQLEEKGDSLRTTAESFQLGATRLEKIARERRWRAMMIIAAMLLSFCLLMYLVFRSPAAPDALAGKAFTAGTEGSGAFAAQTEVTPKATATTHTKTAAATAATSVKHKVKKP